MNSVKPNIVAINASPRYRQGTTRIMLDAFLQGAVQHGAQVDTINLATHNITPCCGELRCWSTRERTCIHRDDMDVLIPRLTDIDYLVLAFPLYIDAMPGILKLFLERLLPLGSPFMEKDETGYFRHGDLEGVTNAYKKQGKLIILSTAGFPEKNNFDVISIWAKRIARNMHTEVAGEIYRGMSAVLSASAPELKPVVTEYLSNVTQACADILEGKEISPDLQQKLDTDLIPKDVYVDHVNFAAMQSWGI